MVTFYAFDGSRAVLVPRWKRAYRKLFRAAALVVVLCEAVRDRLVDLGCPPDRIRIWRMPAGVELYTFREPVMTEETRFLIAARFVEKKGYPVLISAFEQLVRSGLPVRLTMIGYGPLLPVLQNSVREAGLEDRWSSPTRRRGRALTKC
jgi:colanic acid/amylovoran biosynthesis glycosyltransferase